MVALQIAALTALYITYRVVSSYIRRRQFDAFAKANGCLSPIDVSKTWLGSLMYLRRILDLKDSGEDILEDILLEDFKLANTFRKTLHDGSYIITTMEPANLQAMFATQFKDFEIGPRRIAQFSPVLGHSIFTSDGSFWEHSRALLRPQFSRENINDLDATDSACTALITAAGVTDHEGWTANVDLMPLFFNYTLDTASEFLFGESVDSQTAAMATSLGNHIKVQQTATEQAASREFLQDFAVLSDYMLRRIRLQSLYWLGDGIRFRRAISNTHRFVAHFVKKAIDGVETGKTDDKKYSLLSALATQTRDRDELRDQILAVLLAGRDTTAGTLGWAFVRLALHPDIFTNLRHVVLREFVPGESITFAKLKGCRPLQHFINEILRLHPNVPFNNRYAARDTTLPLGGGPDGQAPIAVRKGQVVGFSVYAMHRRTDLWGDDAREFKPERWEQRVPAWHWLPFSGGPRICLGQQFALTETSYVLVRMLQHFDSIEPVDAAEMRKFRKGLGLTMWPGDGVKVRLHKA